MKVITKSEDPDVFCTECGLGFGAGPTMSGEYLRRAGQPCPAVVEMASTFSDPVALICRDCLVQALKALDEQG